MSSLTEVNGYGELIPLMLDAIQLHEPNFTLEIVKYYYKFEPDIPFEDFLESEIAKALAKKEICETFHSQMRKQHDTN